MFLEISQNSQDTPVPEPFLNKVAGAACEFWEISKNTFFTEHLWATASAFIRLQMFFSLFVRFHFSHGSVSLKYFCQPWSITKL